VCTWVGCGPDHLLKARKCILVYIFTADMQVEEECVCGRLPYGTAAGGLPADHWLDLILIADV